MMLFIFNFLFTLDEPNNWTGSSVCDVVGNESLRLEDAQTVQLEDGTTAYIHHTAKGFSFPLFLICSKMLNGFGWTCFLIYLYQYCIGRYIWTQYPAGGAVGGRVYRLHSSCCSGVATKHHSGHPDEWHSSRFAHRCNYWPRNNQCIGAVHNQGTTKMTRANAKIFNVFAVIFLAILN